MQEADSSRHPNEILNNDLHWQKEVIADIHRLRKYYYSNRLIALSFKTAVVEAMTKNESSSLAGDLFSALGDSSVEYAHRASATAMLLRQWGIYNNQYPTSAALEEGVFPEQVPDFGYLLSEVIQSIAAREGEVDGVSALVTGITDPLAEEQTVEFLTNRNPAISQITAQIESNGNLYSPTSDPVTHLPPGSHYASNADLIILQSPFTRGSAKPNPASPSAVEASLNIVASYLDKLNPGGKLILISRHHQQTESFNPTARPDVVPTDAELKKICTECGFNLDVLTTNAQVTPPRVTALNSSGRMSDADAINHTLQASHRGINIFVISIKI